MIEEFEERSSARPLSSWVAFFTESTEETRKRLGIWKARGLHLSGRGGVLAAAVDEE